MARWLGSIDLEFARNTERTYLDRCRHLGPLRVQRPFYEAGGVCQTYVLHPPAGIVGGDELSVRVKTRDGAHVLLTNPGANKFYRSAGEEATQRQELHVAAGCALEWLPQETIVFDGARARISTRVDVEPEGKFIGWDMLCLGRPAAGEAFEVGECLQGVEIWQGGRPVWLERARYEGGRDVLNASWGLCGRPVVATLLAHPVSSALFAELPVPGAPGPDDSTTPWTSLSLVRDVLVGRYLGHSTLEAREVFAQVWNVLRPKLLGQAAEPPRIWAT